MKKIGMLVAVEIDAVLSKYGAPVKTEKIGMMEFSVYETPDYELIVCSSGVGEIMASAGTQLLITKYGADMIVNFGIVGGLTEEMAVAKSCIVTKVVHYDLDTSGLDPVKPAQYGFMPNEYIPLNEEILKQALSEFPDLKTAVCASADKFVTDPDRKRELHELYGADICDMESAAVSLVTYVNKVPCLMIKTVSDGLGSVEMYFQEKTRTSEIALRLADRIVKTLVFPE